MSTGVKPLVLTPLCYHHIINGANNEFHVCVGHWQWKDSRFRHPRYRTAPEERSEAEEDAGDDSFSASRLDVVGSVKMSKTELKDFL